MPRMPRTRNVDAYDENGNKISFHKELFDLPESVRKEEDVPAPVFYVDYLRHAKEPVTLVAVGPLTNLAVALLIDPDIVKNIEEIVIMGGGHHITNATIAAEFNIYDDPEAAQRVLHCGAKITMVPLDATHEAYMNLADAAEIREIGTKPAKLVADLIESRIRGYSVNDKDSADNALAPIHDALAVCSIIHPECLVDVVDVICHCDISRGFAYGETIIDWRHRVKFDEPANIHFAKHANRDVFTAWVKEVLKKDKERRGTE